MLKKKKREKEESGLYLPKTCSTGGRVDCRTWFMVGRQGTGVANQDVSMGKQGTDSICS